MTSTGIASIDAILGGGIPRGSRVLCSMEPGADGQIFIISTFLSALNKADTPRVLESIVDHVTQLL
jgi:hypothetical protein